MKLQLVSYRHAASEAGKSITELPPDEALALAEALYCRSACKAHRRFDPGVFALYYEARKQAEKRMYESFRAKGGLPEMQHPLYFVLQASASLASGFGDPREIRLELDSLGDDDVSFTLGDSMALYYGGALEGVLTKAELLQRLEAQQYDVTALLPGPAEPGAFVEAQLWTEA